MSPPGRSSAARKPRPRAGGTPSVAKNPAVASAPSIRSGSPSPVKLTLERVKAVIPANERLCARQSTKLGGEALKRGKPRSGLASISSTSRSGSGYGSGAMSTVLTTLKMAVLAPIPRANARSAASERAGLLASARTAKRRSFQRVFIGFPLVREKTAGVSLR